MSLREEGQMSKINGLQNVKWKNYHTISNNELWVVTWLLLLALRSARRQNPQKSTSEKSTTKNKAQP